MVGLFNEDKQGICNQLCELLKLTRAGNGLVSIEYLKEGQEEFAKVYWQHGKPGNEEGFVQKICITGDSGAAIIRDVMRSI